jgi:penicillin-binding protein 2
VSTETSPRVRLGVVAIVCISLFAALFARLWYLQVMNAPAYSQVAVNRSTRVLTIAPPRGRILDRNGNVLVDNTPTKVVALDRQALAKVKDADAVVSRLAGLLNQYQHPKKPFTLAGIKEKLSNNRVGPYEPVPLAEGIDDNLLVFLTEHSSEFPGVMAETQLLRQYHYGPLASQLLGYVGPISDLQWAAARHSKEPYEKDDQVGRAGVEQSFEKYLRGTPGKKVVEVDPTGRIVRTVIVTDPVPGHDVYLTININAQALAEKALADQLAAARQRIAPLGYPPAPAGATVVIQPKTGQVVAMASNPTYDPKLFVPAISNADWAVINDKARHNPSLNRAVSQIYSPGSTFKLVSAMTALKAGLLSPDTPVDDPGSYQVNGCAAPCTIYHDSGGEAPGIVNLTRALSVSSDVYFYKVGDQLWTGQRQYGQTPLQDMAKQFGFGMKTGIELPGEAAGRVPTPASEIQLAKAIGNKAYDGWHTGDSLNLAIGQGDLDVTPLQLANAYAQFANGGTRYQPTLLYKVTDAFEPTKVVYQSVPKVAGHVDIPPAWHDAMLAGFDGVTKGEGTATGKFDNIDQTKFDIAGKTGTAEIGLNRFDNAFFVGWAPAQDPQWVAAAMVEEAGFGADTAAPVVDEIFQPLASTGNFPVVGPVVPWVAPPTATTLAPSPSTTSTTIPGGLPAGSVPDTTVFGQGPTTTVQSGATGETSTSGPNATGGAN